MRLSANKPVMHRSTWCLALCVSLAALSACDGGKAKKDPAGGKRTAGTTSESAAKPDAKPASAPAPKPEAKDDPDEKDDGGGDGMGDGSGRGMGEGDPPKKDWGCGRKKQLPCPMQGWMKKNISKSMSSGDFEKIEKDLIFIADHPVKGFDDWTAIAKEGAAKAKEHDKRGAKQSCKKCHKAYQRKFREEMRDMKWP